MDNGKNIRIQKSVIYLGSETVSFITGYLICTMLNKMLITYHNQ